MLKTQKYRGKFAFVTDTHLYPDAPNNFNEGTQLQENSIELYEELIRSLSEFKPDFVVHGGDVVCGGNKYEMSETAYRSALDMAVQFEKQIDAPIYHIPGNHDVEPKTGSKDAYLDRFAHEGKSYGDFVFGDLKFILMDTQELPDDKTYGHISSEQLEWLENSLQKSKEENQQVLIFGHHLFSASEEFPLEKSRIDNSEQFLALSDRFDNILMTFHGHLHLNRVYNRKGKFHLVTSGIICYPMMWREVMIYDDRIEVKSSQLRLPALLAKSAVARDDRGAILLGNDNDRSFVVPRKNSSNHD